MYGIVVTAQIIGVILTVLAIALVVHMEASNVQKMMICYMIAVLLENSAYLFELLAKAPGEAMIAIKLQYLGAAFVPIFFSQFIYAYCNRKQPDWVFRVIGAIAVGMVVLVWTNDVHHLFYNKAQFVTDGEYPHFVFEYGIAFQIYMLVCIVTPFVMAFWVMIRSFLDEPSKKKKSKYISFSFLGSIPLLAMFVRSQQHMREYDFIPMILAFLLSVVVIFVWSRRTYDLSRVAAKTVLYEIQDGSIFLDDEKRIVSFNPMAAEIFQGLDEELLGKNISRITSFPQEIILTEGKHEFAIGEHYYEGHNKFVTDKSGELLGYVLLIFDITETKRHMEESAEMRAKAEAASIAKSAFMATMTHEMRTPMNAIVGLSELIKEESRGRKVYQFACDIKDASSRLLAIFNDVWDISAVEAGKMKAETKEYSLKSVMLDIHYDMKEKLKDSNVVFAEVVNDSLPNGFCGDIDHIRQILDNLLDNAIKFTKKGKITLLVDADDVSEDEKMLRFVVKDTGIGIQEEDLQKIFYNFEQVDSGVTRSVDGTGLGLSVVKNLAELLGGSISVESVYGKGSNFTVVIPQQVTDQTKYIDITEEMVDEDEQERLFIAPECNILVVDDNLINRKVVLGMLKAYQCKTDEAASGFEALDFVKQKRYDLILMDHMMPELDGVETTKFIRSDCGENGKTPVVIALTANATTGIREFFLENEFQDYVTKPVDRILFHRMLLKWIPKELQMETEVEETVSEDISFDELGELFVNGVNVKSALEQHTGTMSDYLDILNLYYLDGNKKIPYLRELVQKEDYKNYRIEVHALKSASANIGAMALSQKAKALEDAAIAGEAAFIQENGEPFIEELSALLGHISTVLKRVEEKNAIRKPEGKGEVLEGPELLEALKEALDKLEHFKSKECREKITWMLSCEIDDAVRTALMTVDTQLKVYEDDDAEDVLRDIITRLEA
ncbi:MAG: ATP-binding protein [Eubacteriales bacterium]|nr:ATP-binding protein [Eubacteriales bacterium]